MNKLVPAVVALSLVAGCATSPKDIQPTFVTSVAYDAYSCAQVRQALTEVNGEIGRLTGVQKDKASGDAVATGVALVLFWPAAFFIKGDKETANQLAKLKGEHDALIRTGKSKTCFTDEELADLNKSA